ncbi:MAG TPA: hypothetical protein VMW36_07315 [Patescibacteria group bacterium]|nr:hypothetical protein [Patescibacteria group bacterium]
MLFDRFGIMLIKKHAPRIDRALLRDDMFKFKRRHEDTYTIFQKSDR